MSLRIDVGIDPQADRRFLADAGGDVVEATNSSSDSTLNIKISELSAYSISSFFLPTPENTIFFGSPPAFKRAKQLAAGNDIETAAFLGEGSAAAPDWNWL